MEALIAHAVLSIGAGCIWMLIARFVLRLDAVAVLAFGSAMTLGTFFAVRVVCNGSTREDGEW